MEFGNIFMLHIQELAQFGTISTLRMEAERGLSREPRILQHNCLFNNHNVLMLRPMVFENILMLNIKEHAQFGTIPTLRLEAMRGLTLKTSNFAT